MLLWLRRRFIAGLFVTVPLVVSAVALVWLVQFAEEATAGISMRLFGGYHFPGAGLLLSAAIVLAVGAVATNVFGRRVLQRGEELLLHVPVFKTVYAPVKQLIEAFAPDNELGFKRVVLIDDPERGGQLGFLTREFVVDRGRGPETLVAVYVPTNHLYLGDVLVCRPERVSYPDLTVEQGIRIFLTGGMAMPEAIGTQDAPTPGPAARDDARH